MKNKDLQKEITWLLKEKYNGQLTDKAKKDIALLKRGKPLDYVIGFTNFLGCKIDLFYKPLIPRTETEFWTQKVIEDIKKSFDFAQDKTLRVLDIFAGSGCIGIGILKNTNILLCDIVEKDSKLIKQINKNLKLNNIDRKRCKVIQGDIFKNVKKTYDLILANPPYIPTKNKNKVQKSTLKYEPKNALFGGQDGLYFIEKLLKQAKNHLTENGKIYMEFDSLQKGKIEKFLKNFGYKSWQFHKDQFDKWRYVEIQK